MGKLSPTEEPSENYQVRNGHQSLLLLRLFFSASFGSSSSGVSVYAVSESLAESTTVFPFGEAGVANPNSRLSLSGSVVFSLGTLASTASSCTL
jgi:hypothetical protein